MPLPTDRALPGASSGAARATTIRVVSDVPVRSAPAADGGGVAVPDAATPPPPDPSASDAGPMPPGAEPDAQRGFFATVSVEDADSLNLPSDGDLWANCWSDDDALYVANGDGAAFSDTSVDIAVSRITGRPGNVADPLQGVTLATADQVSSIWTAGDYNRKPTGMLCQDGELYLAVQDLRIDTYDDAPAATIVRSRDKGTTWSWDHSAPMFHDRVFTTIMFLDYGKDSRFAKDAYVYAYGLDRNWAYNSPDGGPTSLYLARVPRDRIQDRASWEFFAGFDAQAAPLWTADIDARQPVLHDPRHVYAKPIDPTLAPSDMTVLGQGSVIYDAALDRYLYTSWTEYTFEFYEAPAPWGPWTLFLSKDYGAYPWHPRKNGGYAPTIPTKFISDDGRTMFVQSNSWGPSNVTNYNFSLRRMRLATYDDAPPDNAPGADALSTRSDAVPIARALRHGLRAILNDGAVAQQSEDSFTGEAKPLDYWGYTWPVPLHMNELVYASGIVAANGGWFSRVDVEVRRAGQWHPVSNLRVSPDYAGDASVPSHQVFTFRFDDVLGDGLRLSGPPGGSGYFTSIAELAVYDAAQ